MESLNWSAIEALLPELSRRNGEIEQLGELPPDVVTALRSAGVWRTWLPRELGGFETAPGAVAPISATKLAVGLSVPGFGSATAKPYSAVNLSNRSCTALS